MSRLVPALLISNLILGSLLIVGWTSKPGVVQASRFELVDDEGNARGTFAQKDGIVGLFLKGPGKASLLCTTTDSGVAMYFTDKDGHLPLAVVVGDAGSSIDMQSGECAAEFKVNSTTSLWQIKGGKSSATGIVGTNLGAGLSIESSDSRHSTLWGQRDSGQQFMGFFRDKECLSAFPPK